MNILIVAPFCSIPGEAYFNRFMYLAELLSEKHNVVLITSNFSHFTKTRRLEKEDEIAVNSRLTIKLINEPGYKKNASIFRVLSHYIFCKNFEIWLKNQPKEKFSIVYSAYPLIQTNIILGKLKNEKNFKLIIDVQDVWPESFSSVLPILSKIPLDLIPFTHKANTAYSNADALVAVSNTYIQRAKIANKLAKSLVVYIGCDGGRIEKIRPELSIIHKDKINFVYIGTLSHSYDLLTIIHAFNKRTDKEKIHLHIIGEGPQRLHLMKHASSNITFYGPLNYEKTISICKSCNIAVNPIKTDAKQSVTNKLSDYLYLGLPILNSQENPEVLNLLANHPHIQYKSGSIESCISAINFACDKFNSPSKTKILREKFDRRISHISLLNFINDFS